MTVNPMTRMRANFRNHGMQEIERFLAVRPEDELPENVRLGFNRLPYNRHDAVPVPEQIAPSENDGAPRRRPPHRLHPI